MKKMIILLAVACMLFSAAGCSTLESKSTVFTVEGYSLQLTADSTFEATTGSNFDLQITDDNVYIGVMAYKYIDLAENTTPLDVYALQNETLFSKRTAVMELEAEKTQSLAEAVITQGLFSAERDGLKNYYATYLIDLPEAETCAWVLVSSLPSYFENHRDALHTIVCSLQPVK